MTSLLGATVSGPAAHYHGEMPSEKFSLAIS